jgi:ATP-dependent RNA helicase RhlE
MLEKTATGRVLIFTRTKHRAKNLARDLEKNSYRVSALEGNMTQNRRQSAINGFRDGKYDILVATDIASRGIDVSEISHVINYDMPNTVEAYTHRIGRTGRACHSGEAFSFAGHADETMIREIEHVLGARIERRRLEDFDYSSMPPEALARPIRTGPRPSRPGQSGEAHSPRDYSRAGRSTDRNFKGGHASEHRTAASAQKRSSGAPGAGGASRRTLPTRRTLPAQVKRAW